MSRTLDEVERIARKHGYAPAEGKGNLLAWLDAALRHRAAETVAGPDGATPTAPLSLSGVVKTSKGYAVARATLKPDGTVEAVSLMPSQAFKQYVAAQHKRIVLAEALGA